MEVLTQSTQRAAALGAQRPPHRRQAHKCRIERRSRDRSAHHSQAQENLEQQRQSRGKEVKKTSSLGRARAGVREEVVPKSRGGRPSLAAAPKGAQGGWSCSGGGGAAAAAAEGGGAADDVAAAVGNVGGGAVTAVVAVVGNEDERGATVAATTAGNGVGGDVVEVATAADGNGVGDVLGVAAAELPHCNTRLRN